MSDTPDAMTLAARYFRDLPNDWKWHAARVVDKVVTILDGGVPTRKISRGPRAGRDDWRTATNRQTVAVTREEMREAVARWEAETGKCHPCGGTGQEAIGWSKDSGTKRVPCRKCGASGKAATS